MKDEPNHGFVYAVQIDSCRCSLLPYDLQSVSGIISIWAYLLRRNFHGCTEGLLHSIIVLVAVGGHFLYQSPGWYSHFMYLI